MYQTPEHLVALNKANLELAIKLAGVAFHGAERLLDVQLKAARSAYADTVESARAIANARDVQALVELQSQAKPTLEKATAYARSLYDATTETQAELGRLLEEQVAEYNRQVVTALDGIARSAPAGSEFGVAALKSGISAFNAAYDNIAKASRQFAETARASMDAAAENGARGARKSRKS